MARVFIDSFEAQDFNNWDQLEGTPVIGSTAGLDMKGDYCANLAGNDYIHKILPNNSEYYFAFHCRVVSNATGNVLTLRNGGTQIVRARTTSSKFYYEIPGGNVWGTKQILSGITYFIECYLKVADSGGRFVWKIDGVTDLNFTGDTKPGSVTVINRMVVGNDAWYDNIIVDDSEYPGNTEIALLKLNGIGASSEWVPSAGDNYACVDEVPFSDADYISTDIVDEIDTYNLQNLPSAAKSIKCVQAQVRVKRSADAVPNNVNLVLRADGSDYHGSNKALAISYGNVLEIWSLSPSDSQPFEKADIDAMEIGVRSRS
jgi:hypothetical protein